MEERSNGVDLRPEGKPGTRLQAGVRTPRQALDAAGSSLQPITDSLQVHERRSESGSVDGRFVTENRKGSDGGIGYFKIEMIILGGKELVFT